MRPVGSTKERRAIYKDEFNTLLKCVFDDKSLRNSSRVKLLTAFTILFNTGCRVGEIVGLKISDLEYIATNGVLALDNNTKTKRPRTILFNERMILSIKELIISLSLKNTSQAFIFSSGSDDIPMSKKALTMFLNGYLTKYLNDLYTTHSFRAGYVTRIVEATGNLKTAQDMVGHRSINTTIRYLATSERQKLEALNKAFGV